MWFVFLLGVALLLIAVVLMGVAMDEFHMPTDSPPEFPAVAASIAILLAVIGVTLLQIVADNNAKFR